MRNPLLTPLLFLMLLLLSTPHSAEANPPAAPPGAELLVPAELAPPATLDAPSTTPPVPDPAADPGAYISAVTALAKAGKWLALAGALLVGLVFLLRNFVLGGVSWFQTNRGGALLAICTAFLVGFGSALGGGLPFGGAASAGLALMLATVGAYVIPRKVATTDPAKPPPVPLRAR